MKRRRSLILSGGILIGMALFLPGFLSAESLVLKDAVHPRVIETWELQTLTGNSSVRIVDMRTSIHDYLKGHVPNAVYLSPEALQVPENGIPAQAPARSSLEKLLGDGLGVSNSMWVMIYSEKSNPNATGFAWILDLLGHKKVAVLNGGWEKWASEGLPATQAFPALSPHKFFGKVFQNTTADKNWVRDWLNSKHIAIVDARSPAQYSGEEGGEIRRGHIPGARNIFWETTLEGESVRVWKKREELEKLFAESGVTRDKEIVIYSLAGTEASHLYFTLKNILKFPKVHLYRGGWIEWASDSTMPVRAGIEP